LEVEFEGVKMRKFKDSRRGVSAIVVVAAIILIVIVVVAALYALQIGPFGVVKTELIMGTTDSVESAVDPAQAYDFFGWEIIQNTGAALVDIEPGSSAGPEDYTGALATDWTPSIDLKTWTFTLREGVLFEDGTEFNASHVKYSFDRNIGIASPDGPQYNMDYAGIIDSIDVVSTYEVKFNLKVPFSPFLQLMACQASSIVNPQHALWDAYLNYTAGDARASTPMDLGPYMLTEWVRTAGKDDRIVLDVNPYYWNLSGGYPKTDRIIYEFYADSTGLRLAIEAGDIDIAFRQLSADDLMALRTNPNLKVWSGSGAFIQYMIFQEEEIPGLRTLNDSRIRRAIAASINRPQVCDTVFLNLAEPLYSMIPAGMLGHTEAFEVLGDANYTYTQSLLDELGYNVTNKLEIELWYESSGHYPSSDLQAALYAFQLEASDVISVSLHSADWPSYRLNRNDGIMHVFVYGWYPDYVDPDNYAFLYWAPWLDHHYIDYGVNYQDMVDAFNDARNTTDAATRISLYEQLENYAVEDCPVIPIYQSSAWAVSKLDVEGVILDISQAWRNWLIIPEFPVNLLAVFIVMTIITVVLTRKFLKLRDSPAKSELLV